MTVTGEPQRPLPPEGDQTSRPARRRDASAVLEVCPFLAAGEGGWRSAYAAREHHCQAVVPPAALAVAKQRQLCLLAAHVSCATYAAAMDLRADAAPITPGDDGAALWASAAPGPVVLEPARRMGAMPTASAKSGGQALLIGLMVLAFIVLVIARTQSPGGGGAAGSPDVSLPAAVASTVIKSQDPTVAPTPSDVASPTSEPTPAPTPAATAAPDATASAVATKRYRVKSGDTLSTIAAAFGTTVKKIARLNNITDPRLIHVGQVLLIPVP